MSARLIEGAGGGSSGGSTHTPVEAPDNLKSTAYANIIDLVSEGEIEGFALGSDAALQCCFLDQTPVGNADGTLNFSDVQIDSRSGTQTQTYLTGFPDVENEISIGTELRYGTPFVREFTDMDMSAVGVRLSVPNGLQKENTSNGDINGYTVAYTIEIQADSGAWQLMVSSSFTGKASGNYERQHRIDLPPATTSWNVRVTRTTTNADSATIADTTNLESVTEIIDGKFSYPNSAVIGIVVDATQFSSIPTRSYHLKGRIIQVPSNYDPVARTYTGTWDGSFKPAYSNNPAWVYYDLATHPRYGLGNLISATTVDKWSLYAISQYCDGMVPDGKGGTEPRFTCNLFLQQQDDAYKVMGDIASIFRGIAYYAGNALSASADMPGDPVYTYTAANVINGLFTYNGSPRTTRYTVCQVSWNDPSNFYSPAVETVVYQPGLARYGIQQTSIQAWGCTSQGQAQRAGMWALLTSFLEGETVTFSVGLEGIISIPGQIVRIGDAKRMGRRVAGRINASTATSVTVDQIPPVINVGDTLTVTLPTGTTESHAVTAIAGNTITVATPGFSAIPVPQSVWIVESTSLVAPTYRVLTTKDNGDGTFTINAARHDPTKFAQVDSGTIIQEPPTSILLPKTQGAPATVTLIAVETAGQVNSSTVLNISWTPASNASQYQVAYRYNNGEWASLAPVSGLSVSIPAVQPGDYIARVSGINAAGNSSAPTVSATYTVIDQTVQPESVSAAQSAAAAASASAATANAQLAQIASDGVLTPAEKSTVIQDANVILSEQAGIDIQAAAYSIVSQKTAYDNAVTALSAYLATLTTPTLWSDLTGNTNIVSSAFRSAFSTVYTTRQTLLNAIYAGAQSLANNAQSSANQANTSANNLNLVNLSFAQGMYGWTPSNDASSWSAETGGNGPNGGTATYVIHATDTVQSSLGNVTRVPVYPKQVIKASGQCRGYGTPNGAAALYIVWLDINGAVISTPNSNQVTGNGQFQLELTATAPANAAFASMGPSCGAASGTPQGHYSFANFAWNYQPASIDEVPNGTTYSRTLGNTLQNGVPIQFSGGKNVIPNGTLSLNFGATPGSVALTQGASVTDGWVLGVLDGAHQVMFEPSTTGSDILFRLVGGASIAAGATATSQVSMFANMPAPSSAPFAFTVVVSGAASVGLNAGFSVNLICYINWYSGTGSLLGQTVLTQSGNSFAEQTLSAVGTTPAGTVAFSLAMQTNCTNSNGSAGAAGAAGQLPADLRVYEVALVLATQLGSEVAGTLSTQKNMPIVTIGNYASGWNGETITYSATTTSVTISCSAATLQLGNDSVSYNASSITLSGTAGSTVTYYLFYSDPGYTGGSKTLQASTSNIVTVSNNGYVFIGSVTLTFPTSGTGSGGGTRPCVSIDAFVRRRRNGKVETIRAGDVEVGDELRLLNPRTLSQRWGAVTYSVRRETALVYIETADGVGLTCSTSAPIGCSDGSSVLAPKSIGEMVPQLIGHKLNDQLISLVEDRGVGWVQHITCENDFFLAGDDPCKMLAHHNLKPT